MKTLEYNVINADSVPTTTYKAAGIVAKQVELHFKKHHQSAKQDNATKRATIPKAAIIETIIDITFWASLRREEGRSPKISIAYVNPENVENPLIFGEKLKFTTHVLTKLAPAVERSGIHLGVWLYDNELYIWGTTQFIPGLCFVLEVIEPGVLVIKHRRVDGFGKFVNVAVLKGDQIKVINEESGKVKDCPSLVNSMLGTAPAAIWHNSLNLLVQLSVSMRDHGRGGILLVVPSEHDRWRESIIHPISYAVEPAFSQLAHIYGTLEKESGLRNSNLSSAINYLAGLTAVDGATVINSEYELLAFGAKIGRSPEGTPVEEILVTEPIIGIAGKVVHPVQNGGTRHLSAAQFIHDQHDAIALVASQDGRFTIFSWAPHEGKVQAHRVDALLL